MYKGKYYFDTIRNVKKGKADNLTSQLGLFLDKRGILF